MYFRDHAPPHFHAEYSGHEALVEIEDFTEIRGRLPVRARRLVMEWASLHQDELLVAWNKTKLTEAPGKIAPLE